VPSNANPAVWTLIRVLDIGLLVFARRRATSCRRACSRLRCAVCAPPPPPPWLLLLLLLCRHVRPRDVAPSRSHHAACLQCRVASSLLPRLQPPINSAIDRANSTNCILCGRCAVVAESRHCTQQRDRRAGTCCSRHTVWSGVVAGDGLATGDGEASAAARRTESGRLASADRRCRRRQSGTFRRPNALSLSSNRRLVFIEFALLSRAAHL